LDYEEKLSVVMSALRGDRGPDQRRIAEVGLDWLVTLIHKNSDYGSSAWKVPVLAPDCDTGVAIRVRMSDKISRIESLIKRKGHEVDESFNDTINDLGAYCLLFLARPQDTTPEDRPAMPIE